MTLASGGVFGTLVGPHLAGACKSLPWHGYTHFAYQAPGSSFPEARSPHTRAIQVLQGSS